MSLRINTNIEAFNAHRQLDGTQTAAEKSMEKLSSGLRINRAADDAAGLAISREDARPDQRHRRRPPERAWTASRMVQTAEGALNEVHSILQRVRELAVQYNNGTLSTADQAAITAEITQLSAEVGRIVDTTQFNGINLLSRRRDHVTFQVGANAGETITLANANLGGAYFDNVFAHPSRRLGRHHGDRQRHQQRSPTSAPPSAPPRTASSTPSPTSAPTRRTCPPPSRRIRDVDVAAEMVNFTKLQILSQSGTACSPRPTSCPQSVLKLLQ